MVERVTSEVGPESVTLPSRSTVTRSQMSTTSLRWCEMKTTEMPCVVRLRMAWLSDWISVAEREAVGSSRMRMLASWEIALAISTS